MGRGLERRSIFLEDADRAEFVARVARRVEAGAWTVSARALLPNHAHPLVRTGQRPLPRRRRSLLTGYAGAFNRRHHRVGHLVQNRYTSIVVEAEPYRLELVRSIHLNPLRATVVPDLRPLDRYPWTGHRALLARVARPWQTTATILNQCARSRHRAWVAYRVFVAEGVAQGRRPEFQGGGLRRSLGGWHAVGPLRRGRAAYRGDARVLGSRAFVETLRRTVAARDPVARRGVTLTTLATRVCRQVGVPPDALAAGGRTRSASQARAGIAYLWTTVLGHPGRPLAPVLGVRPQNVSRAAAHGQAAGTAWDRLLTTC